MANRFRLVVAVLLTLGVLALRPHPTYAATTVNDCPQTEAALLADIGNQGWTTSVTIDFNCSVPTTIPFTTNIPVIDSLTLDASSSPQPVTFDGGRTSGGTRQTNFFVVDNTLTLNSLTLQNGVRSFYGSGLDGGAIDNEFGIVNIINSTFHLNETYPTHFGGAIYNNEGAININNSIFNSNFSGYGGAIVTYYGPVNINNSTFYGNSVSGGGYGNVLYNSFSTTTIRNSTIAGNGVAGSGTGAIADSCCTVNVSGSIISNNVGGNCYRGGFVDQGSNLESGTDCGFTRTGSLQNTDPKLDPSGPKNNGGPTGTIALEPGSPAIDRIPTGQNGCPSTPGTDQRGPGFPRPDENESACDIGAYETEPVPSSITAVSGSGTYGSTATLTAQLSAAGAGLSGKTVTFTLNGNPVCGSSTGVTCPVTDNGGVATLNNVSLAGINAGSFSGAVSAAFAGDSTYTSAGAAGDLNVAMANQSINVTQPAPDSASYGSQFVVAATADSGLDVSYSSDGGCSNSGSTFTMTSSTAACLVTFTQTGDSNYNPAASITETVSATKAQATITLNDNSLTATYDGNPHLATAKTTPDNLSYGLSYTDANNNAVASPTDAGSYTVVATITDPNYAGSTTGTLVINQANQSITVSAHAPTTLAYNGTFEVAATASSGLDVTYGSSGSCSNSGATFTMTAGAGTCSVTYSQTGNGNYNAAQTVTETVTAQKADQTISFGTLPDKTYGDASFSVTASTSSGLTVSYSAAGACTISASTATITGAGSCTITASQAGDGNYNAATNVLQSFNIAKAGTITSLTSAPNPSIIKQTVTFTATVTRATAGSGTPAGTVTFKDGTTTLASGIALNASGAAMFATNALTGGSHTITASYSGSSNFISSAVTQPLSQQVRYNVKVLSTSKLTIALQLQDYNSVNVSAFALPVTAECVVSYSATVPTTCGTNPVQSINKAAGFSNNYKGMGPAYAYSVNARGLTKTTQYYLLIQAGGDPIWHAIPFTA